MKSLPLTLAATALGFAAAAETPLEGARAAHTAYVAAINSGDRDRFLATVTEDIVFIAPNAPVLVGKDQLAPWVDGYLAAVEPRWVKTTLEIVAAGDWAYEVYSYRATDHPRDGGPAATETGNGINIYRRGADGVWRVARDAWTPGLAKASEFAETRGHPM